MGLRLGGGLLLLGLSVGLVLVLEFEIWLGLKFWKVGHSSRRRKKKTKKKADNQTTSAN